MWTGDVQIPTRACKEHVVRQSVKEQTNLKTSLPTRACKEHVVRQSVKEQTNLKTSLSYNSQDFSCSCTKMTTTSSSTPPPPAPPISPTTTTLNTNSVQAAVLPTIITAMDQRIQAAVQQHRPTAGPSLVSPSVSSHRTPTSALHRNGSLAHDLKNRNPTRSGVPQTIRVRNPEENANIIIAVG